MQRTETQLLFGGHFLTGAAHDGTRPLFNLILQSIKKAIDEHDWRTIVAISKRLYANMGVPKGAIHLKAMLSIGRAWDPVYLGQNAAWGEEATNWLKTQFYPVYNVRGPMFDFQTDLYLDSVSIDRCGEAIYMLTGSGGGFPMVQSIPNYRVRSPKGQGMARDVDIVVKVPRHLTDGQTLPGDPADGPVPRKMRASYILNGIAYNSFSRPFAYCVYGEDEQNTAVQVQYEWVHEQYIIHIFDPEYYEQGRGLPAFSHGVRQFISMLTSQEFEEITQMVMSSISLIETNESGTTDANDPTTAIGANGDRTRKLVDQQEQMLTDGTVPDVVIDKIVGGVVKYFRSGTGGKIEPMMKSSPGDMWDKFQDRLVRTCLTGINMPYSIIWKHDENTGVADRSDIERLHLTIEDRQTLLWKCAYRKICYGLAVAMNSGKISRNTDDWLEWTFTIPPEFSIDDGKLAQSRRLDFTIGHENLTPILGAKGRTLIPFLRERANEVYQRKKIAQEYSKDGIVVEPWEMGTINPQAIQEEVAPGETPPAGPTDASTKAKSKEKVTAKEKQAAG